MFQCVHDMLTFMQDEALNNTVYLGPQTETKDHWKITRIPILITQLINKAHLAKGGGRTPEPTPVLTTPAVLHLAASPDPRERNTRKLSLASEENTWLFEWYFSSCWHFCEEGQYPKYSSMSGTLAHNWGGSTTGCCLTS